MIRIIIHLKKGAVLQLSELGSCTYMEKDLDKVEITESAYDSDLMVSTPIVDTITDLKYVQVNEYQMSIPNITTTKNPLRVSSCSCNFSLEVTGGDQEITINDSARLLQSKRVIIRSETQLINYPYDQCIVKVIRH